MAVTLLPSPPPSSPLLLPKKRKLEASYTTGSCKQLRNFTSGQVIEVGDSGSDEENNVIVITDSD